MDALTTNLGKLTTIVNEAKTSLVRKILGNQATFTAFQTDTQIFWAETMDWLKAMMEAVESMAVKDNLSALQM